PEYLDQHDRDTHALPRYIARIREGNKESHEFLRDEAARAQFVQAHGLDADVSEQTEPDAVNGTATPIEMKKPSAIAKRITLHEIYESTEMAKLLKSIAAIGLGIGRFSPTEEPRYTITENPGQKSENKT